MLLQQTEGRLAELLLLSFSVACIGVLFHEKDLLQDLLARNPAPAEILHLLGREVHPVFHADEGTHILAIFLARSFFFDTGVVLNYLLLS